MNSKSLNKEALRELFYKYRDIPNINEIKVMGKITEFNNANKAVKDNPNYNMITPKGEENNLPPFETVKLVLDLPSPIRKDEKGKSYTTRLPLFSTGDSVVNYKNILDGGNTKYVCGIGRIQNYRVKSRFPENKEINQFLFNLVERIYGEPNLEVYKQIKDALRVSYNGADADNVELTNIWSNNVENGDDLAKELIDQGKIPEVNKARIQGLVYMPPSIRQLSSGKMSLHVKVRVRRQDTPEQPIPRMHQSKYDFINIIAFGEKTEELYDKIKQGHPIYVSGRLETSRFRKPIKVGHHQENQLSNILGVLPDSPYIKDIANFLDEKNQQVSFPNFNIWADNIIYEEDKLFEK